MPIDISSLKFMCALVAQGGLGRGDRPVETGPHVASPCRRGTGLLGYLPRRLDGIHATCIVAVVSVEMLGSGQLGGSPARPGGAQPEGKAAALGLYEDLLHCLMPGEAFVEYGVVEHRYESLRPEVFQRLVEDYSHTRLGRNKPFTASVFIALVLRRLAERGEVLQTVVQATGPWSHNEVIYY